MEVTLPYLVMSAEKNEARTVRDPSEELMKNTGRLSGLGPLYTFAAWRTQVLPILVWKFLIFRVVYQKAL